MEVDSQDEYEEEIRSAEEVACRCLVLHAVLAVGHEVPREEVVSWLHRERLWDAVSPAEAQFLQSGDATHQQRINATWRAEALFPLLWSLKLIPELPSPQQHCDLQLIVSVLPPLFGPAAEFIASAQLRSDSEIQAANEEILHIHWRIRDERLRGQPTESGKLPRMQVEDEGPPVADYDAGVVQERHYALNWLIGYCGQDWDDITTDT